MPSVSFGEVGGCVGDVGEPVAVEQLGDAVGDVGCAADGVDVGVDDDDIGAAGDQDRPQMCATQVDVIGRPR